MAENTWPEIRAAMVAEGNRLLESAEEWEVSSDLDPWVITARKMPDQRSKDRLSVLQESYRLLLPDVVVARCPDTGVPVHWAIDTGGLDGWFWDSDHPIGRAPQLPPTWLAMTGAVRVVDPVPETPFLCRPGPAVPYVVPRVLDEAGVRAVIAQVPVGSTVGWAISYFGPRLPDVRGIGRWGDDWAPSLGDGAREHGHQTAEDNVYDLDPYLASGKLLWIAPGGDTLGEGVDGCPYRGLTGSREFAYIQNGNRWDTTTVFEDLGVPGLCVEFDGTGMTPSRLDSLRSALALDPVDDVPRHENAVLGRRTAGADLPPGTKLLLFRGTPWRLELRYRGDSPAMREMSRVRVRLLAVLSESGFQRGNAMQWRADGSVKHY